jgi:tellurite resistance protein TehA-like permease
MNVSAGDFNEPASRKGSTAPHPYGAPRVIAAWIGREISILDPSYFALVMATGIVSNALLLHGERAVSDALFSVNLVAYPLLWLLTVLRAARFPAAIGADLVNPRRVFLFFTAVAATDVLGMSIGLRGFTTTALIMWLFALSLWLVLIYLGFGVLMLRNKAGGADVAEGAWLNAIVGTQSLVIIGGAVALPALHIGPQAFVLLPMLWGIGLILYGIFVALLSYRFFFAELRPDDATPPLWIVMGAAAISVNAGAILFSSGGATPFLRSLQPFLGGVTLATWAWATWWIPLLLLLGLWKHGVHGRSIGYTPMLWGIVFPLGMYAAATLRLSEVAVVPALGALSWVMTWVALTAWCATGAALIAALLRRVRTILGLAQCFARTAATRDARSRH